MKNCENCKQSHNGSYGSGRFCSTKCARGFSTKAKRKEINEKVSLTLINSYTGINSAFYKANPNYTKKKLHCPICNQVSEVHQSSNKKFCSRKCADRGRKTTPGGLRYGSGRGKSGWYKNYWCDSSWELAWVIYHLDHGIKFKRNKEFFNYTFKGKTKKYYPDFLIEDTFIEIKGYKSVEFEAKLKQLPKGTKIRVLYKDDLKSILEYVVTNYGSDYIRLYKNSQYEVKKKLCKICGNKCKNVYCSRICAGKGVSNKK